ncbi:hypothetical protein INR49_025039 [Caranx melampygus]|nr:hypothetical protein INR49_025039 [Caranx melampygus]
MVPWSQTAGMCEAEKKDLYAVLGARPSDSVQQLRSRYQQLALQADMDRCLFGLTTMTVDFHFDPESLWEELPSDPTAVSETVGKMVFFAQELKQDGPVDSTVYLEDMTWDKDEGVFTHCCRCGGEFSISEEEVEEESQRRKHNDEAEETVMGQHTGVVVCCDTCSLSVCVTWS